MPPVQRVRESSVTPRLLSIGELAERTGVATTALRYYDELGLVRPTARASGRRRYPTSAVMEVGVILFLREVGFSLAEIGSPRDRRRAAGVARDRRPEAGRGGRAATPPRRGSPPRSSTLSDVPRASRRGARGSGRSSRGSCNGLSVEESHARAPDAFSAAGRPRSQSPISFHPMITGCSRSQPSTLTLAGDNAEGGRPRAGGRATGRQGPVGSGRGRTRAPRLWPAGAGRSHGPPRADTRCRLPAGNAVGPERPAR